MFNRDFFINIIKILILILVQAFVFDHIEVMGKAQPFFYLVFVLFYPPFGNRYSFLLLAFLLGLGVDFMQQTGGIHAFSTVLVAFFRFNLLRLISGQSFDEYDRYNNYELTSFQFILMALVIIFIHHLTLFVLENFKLAHTSEVLISALFSTILTFIFVMIYKILFKRQRAL